MKRRLFNLAAAVSLLLCVATVGLWIRGQSWGDWVELQCSGWSIGIESRHGQVTLRGWRDAAEQPQGWFRYSRHDARRKQGVIYMEPGYRWRPILRSSTDSTVVGRALDIPSSALVTAFGAPALAWASYRVVRYRRFVRLRREGRCPTCGYDLRATPERCPECGTPAKNRGEGSPSRAGLK